MHRRPISLFAAVTLAAFSMNTFGADPTERTSMPEYCANRDVSCVLPDNAPARVISGSRAVPQQPVTTIQTAPATAGFTVPGTAATTSTVVNSPATGTGIGAAGGAATSAIGASSGTTGSGSTSGSTSSGASFGGGSGTSGSGGLGRGR